MQTNSVPREGIMKMREFLYEVATKGLLTKRRECIY
jgi:hypothetical protein